MAEKSAYSILNVRKDATPEDVKRSYIELVKKFDPEKHTDRFMIIQRAYESLREPRKRAHEDVFSYNFIKGQFLYSDAEKEEVAEAELSERLKELQARQEASPGDEETTRAMVESLMRRSYVLIRRKAWREAVEDWERLLELDPTHHRAKNNLTHALAQLGYQYAQHNLFDEAVTNWARALQFNPENYDVVHNMALALDSAGRREEARPYWAEMLKRWKAELDKNPDDVYLRERVIEVHKHQGDQARDKVSDGKAAIREYSEILKIDSNDFEAQYQIAVTLMHNRDFPGARDRLFKIHQQHPQNIEVLNLLGWALLNCSEHDKAFQTWRRALQIEPNNPEARQSVIRARMDLARSLRERSQFTYALVHYKELARMMPDSEEVTMEIAKTFQLKGDKRSAEREYRRVLQLNPSSRPARKALSELKMGR